ncbi:hypothetical protein [Micromonospora sp. NBC_01796]|uniref:hypothetical protein n=1 Tax=Micromonospora sp. NBC_01796 TaxID=2975987 RepID=UPI002DDA4E77|nr:hypothetical protein [Micromonospora sp. NBC_01796]WSA83887.1 hypothetical protein OIE47_26430 [Micromonospora sp. NBC_01796]
MAVFLTELDPRARIKGSRDGLGAQPVWSAMGRPLIGNLTTVTTDLSAFTTLLVGLRLAEIDPGEDDAQRWAAFLVWEQMVGYVRHAVYGDRGFFGRQRVAARAESARSNGGKVRLSADPAYQILSNQKTDGLLGNYVAPARASGLVAPGSPARLTPDAAAFVDDTYLPRLATAWGRDAQHLTRALKQQSYNFDLRDNSRLAAVAAVFGPVLSAQERDFYRHHLIDGGSLDPTGGRQARLASLIEVRPRPSAGPLGPYVARLAEDAEGRGWVDVSEQLRRIAACESVLAPATVLFSYLLGRDDAHLDTVVEDLRAVWGDRLESVHERAAAVLPDRQWRDIADGLAQGDWRRLTQALAQRNAAVMRERGGGLAWLEVTDGDRLRVRFRDEPVDLPTADGIRDLWWYPYFLPSLIRLVAATGENA